MGLLVAISIPVGLLIIRASKQFQNEMMSRTLLKLQQELHSSAFESWTLAQHSKTTGGMMPSQQRAAAQAQS